MRKIAEQIPLSPTITLRDGLLLCTIYCPVHSRFSNASPRILNLITTRSAAAFPCLVQGAITVHETMIAGESLFFEPNQDVTYKVSAYWDGATFVSYRNCPAVYGAWTTRAWGASPSNTPQARPKHA